jgi:hypothetical protein
MLWLMVWTTVRFNGLAAVVWYTRYAWALGTPNQERVTVPVGDPTAGIVEKAYAAPVPP